MVNRLVTSVCMVLFLAILSISAGCGDATEVDSKASDLANEESQPEIDRYDPLPIYYGQTSPTLYTIPEDQQNAVVALYFKAYNSGFCTGTLISPSVVLTAAHCINQTDSGMGVLGADDVEIHIGPNSASPIARLSVQRTAYNTSWNGSERNDCAVVILSNPYYDVTPIPIKNGANNLSNGSRTQSVGYGMTQNSSDYNPNTIRYWTDMPVTSAGYSVISVNGYGNTGVAPGDSGGPLLYMYDEGLRVVGDASTSQEGWVYQGNYAPVSTNESWIQTFVDQYDNPACLSTCNGIECGEYNGCNCGGCGQAEQCVDNVCEALQAGEGGVCITLQVQSSECTGSSQCSGDEICANMSTMGGRNECGLECGPIPCSADDWTSYCLPLQAQGGGYVPLCIERSPETCYQENTACTTSDNRSGYCLNLYGSGLGCFTSCEPVVTCPEGTGCIPYSGQDCDEVCATKQCGTASGCECGLCAEGYECRNYQCVDPNCEPDCDGRQCGTDNCGGSCGLCPLEYTCNEDSGQCISDNDDDDDNADDDDDDDNDTNDDDDDDSTIGNDDDDDINDGDDDDDDDDESWLDGSSSSGCNAIPAGTAMSLISLLGLGLAWRRRR